MDRVDKALRKLPKAERGRYQRIITDVVANRLADYDIIKLVGRDDVFRLRKGPTRVIFRRWSDGENIIIALERRSETTYRKH